MKRQKVPVIAPSKIDVLVVRAAEREIGRQDIAVRYRHETHNYAARIDLDNAAEPGHLCPQIALDVVMDAVGAAVSGTIGARLDAREGQMQRVFRALRAALFGPLVNEAYHMRPAAQSPIAIPVSSG